MVVRELAQARTRRHTHGKGCAGSDAVEELWWFEVFDCVRRLSLTGLLVFVFKGQASQIVVAMVRARMSLTLR